MKFFVLAAALFLTPAAQTTAPFDINDRMAGLGWLVENGVTADNGDGHPWELVGFTPLAAIYFYADGPRRFSPDEAHLRIEHYAPAAGPDGPILSELLSYDVTCRTRRARLVGHKFFAERMLQDEAGEIEGRGDLELIAEIPGLASVHPYQLCNLAR